jgi:hypothetical protein
MPVDSYTELASTLDVRKAKKLPSEDLEKRIYNTIQRQVNGLFG